MEIYPEIPKLKEAIVVSEKAISHSIKVKFTNQPYNNEQLYWVKVLNENAPKKKTYGLVLLSNGKDLNSGIWLGSIDDPLENARSNTVQKNDIYTIDSANKKSSFMCGDSGISISSYNNNFIFNKDKNEIKIGDNTFEINNNTFNMFIKEDNKFLSGINFNRNNFNILSAGELNTQVNEDYNIRINNGSLVISGGPNINKQSNKEDKYTQFKSLVVKNKETTINSANLISFNSSGMNIKLISGKFGGGGGIPGNGPFDTYSLEVVEGNLSQKVGTGNIDIINNNFGIIGNINIRNGSLISPIQNGLTLTAYNSLLEHQTAWGITSSINLSKAAITAKATNEITITSLLRDIALQATTDITLTSLLNTKINASLNALIEAKVKAEIKALTIDIKAQAKAMIEAAIIEIKSKSLTKLETAMLDLVSSKIINAGPKSVAPTGTGPFCALPTCLFTGAPHSGDKAIG